MCMLEQINRRLALLVAERDAGKRKRRKMADTTTTEDTSAQDPNTKPGEPPVEGAAKTVGVLVDAETYALLLKYMERHGVKGVKHGALHALKRGLAADLAR